MGSIRYFGFHPVWLRQPTFPLLLPSHRFHLLSFTSSLFHPLLFFIAFFQARCLNFCNDAPTRFGDHSVTFELSMTVVRTLGLVGSGCLRIRSGGCLIRSGMAVCHSFLYYWILAYKDLLAYKVLMTLRRLPSFSIMLSSHIVHRITRHFLYAKHETRKLSIMNALNIV